MKRDRTIKGLIFDMDGLLFDSERIVQRAWNIAGKRLGYGDNFGDHIYNTIGYNVTKREQYFKEHVQKDFPMDLFNKYTREAYWEIADKEGISLKPGAKEVVQYAKTKGYKLGVATSSRKLHATQLLQTGGMLEMLDATVFGDTVSVAKPHPEIYLKACEKIGLVPEECIAVEDSPAGVESAVAAGMVTIMIPDLVRPTQEIKELADHIYEELFQVIEIL